MKSRFILFLGVMLLMSCKNGPKNTPDMSNLFAWCIVPFDVKQRSPQDRIEMLQRLGFQSYAYDWRPEHLDDMAMELQLAQANGIEVKSVWMWLDATTDSLGALSPDNERVFQIIEEIGLKSELWVSFNENYFENLTDSAAVNRGTKVIEYLSNRAQSLGCKVGLYNHGAWFGEPGNQVKIIQALPDHNLGIIFNFHHAHPQLDYYPEIVETMLPYLWSVNINGMKKDGPKIMTIGQGDEEQGMIQLLMDKGFSRPFGILGHIEEADVEIILRDNLDGFAGLHLKNTNRFEIIRLNVD